MAAVSTKAFRRTWRIAILGAALLASGCASVIFIRNGSGRTLTPAQFHSSKPYWVFGLVGDDQDVYLGSLCLGKEVDQVATYYDSQDLIAGFVTLGMYTPRTVGIWCRL